MVPDSPNYPVEWGRLPIPRPLQECPIPVQMWAYSRMTKLRTLAPLIRAVNTRTVNRPQKQKDAIYDTPAFRVWRTQVVLRAGNRCEYVKDGRRCSKAHPAHRMYADHVVELRDGGHPFDLRNGQCLCAVHHEKKTFKARQLRTEAWSGSLTQPTLPKPNCRVMLICGPPAAGKSTYVRDNAKVDDIVIDLDMIAREHGFGRARPDHAMHSLLRTRNDRLAALAKEPADRTAWVILTAPTQRLRRWWCEALSVKAGDLVVLLPSRTELHRRVMSDPDRKRIIDLHCLLIDKWLAREHDMWPGA
jgi:5-methylcytosine-specific restriction enzyme A